MTNGALLRLHIIAMVAILWTFPCYFVKNATFHSGDQGRFQSVYYVTQKISTEWKFLKHFVTFVPCSSIPNIRKHLISWGYREWPGFFTNIQFRNFEVKRIKAYSTTSSFLRSHNDQSIYKTDLHKVQESFAFVWLLRFHLACVAGVRKGRGRELGRETTCPTRSRAPKFPLPLPLPLPLLTSATQARFHLFRRHRPGADPGFF